MNSTDNETTRGRQSGRLECARLEGDTVEVGGTD